jgi:hypothetical protein
MIEKLEVGTLGNPDTEVREKINEIIDALNDTVDNDGDEE